METLIEGQGAASIALVKDAALSCFAVGKTTGLVVDLSHSSCRATAVTEGWTESKVYTILSLLQNPVIR